MCEVNYVYGDTFYIELAAFFLEIVNFPARI
jgi:hypothetical protein